MQRSKQDAGSPLPDDFLWGAATSAQQAEGNQHNDWSEWESSVAEKLAKGAESRLKNEIPDFESIRDIATDPKSYISGAATDHYNRYKEDFDILKELCLNTYRFSVEWARIEPEPGKYNKTELKHYADMVTELRKRGIEPMVTLHHFTNPTWLKDHGGWHGSEVADRFATYAEVVAKNIGNVKYYMTINEPGSYLLMRYLGGGAWPEWPNLSFNLPQGYRYLKNVVKAHEKAAEKMKAFNPDIQIGLAHAMIDYQLGRRDPLSWLAKKQIEYIPNTYLLNRLVGHVDYIGVNYYLRMLIKSGFSHPAKWALRSAEGDKKLSDMGWGLYPKGLYTITQGLKKYNLPILITENGIADAEDRLRAKYIKDHINEMMRSRKDGADIRGYYYWSLLDNYEWSEGYLPKFGLIAVDRKTQKRTIKPSAKEYSKIIKKYK